MRYLEQNLDVFEHRSVNISLNNGSIVKSNILAVRFREFFD